MESQSQEARDGVLRLTTRILNGAIREMDLIGRYDRSLLQRAAAAHHAPEGLLVAERMRHSVDLRDLPHELQPGAIRIDVSALRRSPRATTRFASFSGPRRPYRPRRRTATATTMVSGRRLSSLPPNHKPQTRPPSLFQWELPTLGVNRIVSTGRDVVSEELAFWAGVSCDSRSSRSSEAVAGRLTSYE